MLLTKIADRRDTACDSQMIAVTDLQSCIGVALALMKVAGCVVNRLAMTGDQID